MIKDQTKSECAAGADKLYSLSPTNFMLFFIVIFSLGPFLIIYRVFQSSSPLWACVKLQWLQHVNRRFDQRRRCCGCRPKLKKDTKSRGIDLLQEQIAEARKTLNHSYLLVLVRDIGAMDVTRVKTLLEEHGATCAHVEKRERKEVLEGEEKNTSWALAAMEDQDSVERILKAKVPGPEVGTLLRISRYSDEQGKSSQGEMQKMRSSMNIRVLQDKDDKETSGKTDRKPNRTTSDIEAGAELAQSGVGDLTELATKYLAEILLAPNDTSITMETLQDSGLNSQYELIKCAFVIKCKTKPDNASSDKNSRDELAFDNLELLSPMCKYLQEPLEKYYMQRDSDTWMFLRSVHHELEVQLARQQEAYRGLEENNHKIQEFMFISKNINILADHQLKLLLHAWKQIEFHLRARKDFWQSGSGKKWYHELFETIDVDPESRLFDLLRTDSKGSTKSLTVHVHDIGAMDATEVKTLLEKHGATCARVAKRERKEVLADGKEKNTSWALAAMEDQESVERILKAKVQDPEVGTLLRITSVQDSKRLWKKTKLLERAWRTTSTNNENFKTLAPEHSALKYSDMDAWKKAGLLIKASPAEQTQTQTTAASEKPDRIIRLDERKAALVAPIEQRSEVPRATTPDGARVRVVASSSTLRPQRQDGGQELSTSPPRLSTRSDTPSAHVRPLTPPGVSPNDRVANARP
eukprot:COSAG01_NODE_4550_length_4932_cov_2.492862_3_plen_695_part_00